MFHGMRFAEHSADVTRAVCIIFAAVSITSGETWLFSIKGSVWRGKESNVFLGPFMKNSYSWQRFQESSLLSPVPLSLAIPQGFYLEKWHEIT